MEEKPSISQAESAIYQRIRRIGKIGRAICSLLLVVAAVAFSLVVLLAASGNWSMCDIKFYNFDVVQHLQPSNLSWFVKTGVLLCITLFFAYASSGIWILRRLFVLFIEGKLFSRNTASLILWLGVWNLASAGLLFHLELLLSGLFLLALGWVMELAASLKDDQDLTV